MTRSAASGASGGRHGAASSSSERAEICAGSAGRCRSAELSGLSAPDGTRQRSEVSVIANPLQPREMGNDQGFDGNARRACDRGPVLIEEYRMETRIKVLLVEDDVVDQMAFKRFIEQSGFPCEYRVAGSVAEGKGLLSADQFDAVVMDYSLGDGTALDLSAAVSDIPFVVTTGIGDELVAVEIMKAGAIDYLAKDPDNNYLRNLPVILESAIKRKKAELELERYRQGLEQLVEERTQELEHVHAQLLHAQKMESIGRFAGSIAHDFNNLLTTIMGYANLVKTSLPPDDPCQEDIDQILKAGQRSTRLTSQLLTFSRRQNLAPRIHDMNELLLDMSKMLRHLLREDIELVMIPSTPPCYIEVDSGQIEQVIINLAVNARDAMPGGGTLIIRTANANLTPSAIRPGLDLKPGQYVVLTVSDTGTGMDEEVQSHLFEPFFTTKDVGKGTGLGLATVYGIIKQHGGDIVTHSEPGQGSLFRAYLPRATEPADEKDRAADHWGTLPMGHETILVVEDEEQILRLMERLLRNSGYLVIATSAPSAALELARAHGGTIDLLLTDVVMPAMNGKDLQEQIKREHPHMKTLFMSGYTADIIVERGVICDDVEFIQKPFKLESLVARVREVLDSAPPPP